MLSNASLKARLYRRNGFRRNLPIAVHSWRQPALKSNYPVHPLKQAGPRTLPFNSQRCLHSTSDQSLVIEEDTIYALSTAPGRAGIAIVRISGPLCLQVWLFIPNNPFGSNKYRSIGASAQRNQFQSLDMPLCAPSTTQQSHPIFSTLMPWYSTFLVQRLSQAKMSWNYTYTVDLQL